MKTDTSSLVEKVRLRALQTMSPARRFSLAAGWSQSVRELTRSSVRKQFPEASERELVRLLADRWLGEELATKVYGPKHTHG